MMEARNAMKRFLAIYLGAPEHVERSGWNALTDDVRKARERAGFEAWMAWARDHAGAIVDLGAPLGRTKRADAAGIADVRNGMAGYVIVQAESHEAAAKMFEAHPHFAIFPGESVEIMECLPLPAR